MSRSAFDAVCGLALTLFAVVMSGSFHPATPTIPATLWNKQPLTPCFDLRFNLDGRRRSRAAKCGQRVGHPQHLVYLRTQARSNAFERLGRQVLEPAAALLTQAHQFTYG